MSEAAGGEGRQAGGLLVSLKTLARSLLALAHTRLDIIGSEIEEQRAILLREVQLAVIAAFCLGLGAAFTALFFVVLYWDSQRLLVIGLFAAAFLIGAGAMIAALRAAGRERPRIFSATIQELDKDRESLR
ncbi:MAG: hypothetical protein A2V78_04425 [Betaproteobacteria bacterium RBG_16_64_18]|nr:MAG: hypothetical protein A2V78_04425 [Betaproteobacteria bacterium RBG_16_64_18]OGA08165.1 MAG: hypothetical protein A3H33_03485 [Betaproteobacteria bacterium RIFCSPLOWO2_02_FULL_65_20]OGA40623.1 MAG: hypothetical protein A3G26_09150 [Betaproteobacteria bacterium RIFCSPLOWO2_12_FULL_65_110]